jgi:hypothetical protein
MKVEDATYLIASLGQACSSGRCRPVVGMQQALKSIPCVCRVFHHSNYHHSGLSPTPSVRVATSMDNPAHMTVMIFPDRGLLVM